MDIKQLETFIAFAKDGSYNRVSQRLNYSVSTLASHIGNLEDEFHIKLVESRGKKTFLTPAGESFLDYARKMMDIYQEAYVAMTSFNDVAGDLRVAVSEMVGFHKFAPLYGLFTRQYPQVSLTVQISPYQNFQKQLINKDVDIAFFQTFVPSDDSLLTSVELYREPVILVASPDHPLGRREEILPRDLRYQTLLVPNKGYFEQPVLKELFSADQLIKTDNLFLDSGILITQALKKRRGLAFLPLSTVENELADGSLARLPWRGEEIYMPVYAIYETRSLALPAIQALIACVQGYLSGTER